MKARTYFICNECGNETPKWSGQCPACGKWNCVVEGTARVRTAVSPMSAASRPTGRNLPMQLSGIDLSDEVRMRTGFKELDRVLGGGAVVGSLVLVGGPPGIGKSTLLLQICGFMGGANRVLYVSGEESTRQIKMRAARLGILEDGVYLLAETRIQEILESEKEIDADVIVIDSIQTLYNPELASAPGSVGQIKDCALSLMRLAKDNGKTVFLVGHINKEGAIAGPIVLEHMVDCVLYFEGEKSLNFKIIRAAKNRFGSTNELGVFEMRDKGLREVMNPSQMLIAERPADTPGTCVTCVIEGTRPILAEVQALVTPGSSGMPRRNSNGIDYNRAMMLLAVLQQRGGLRVGSCDAYINVIGGLSIEDPGADLAVVLALASAFKDKYIRNEIAVFGEVGLTGELRQVMQVEQRISEVSAMGFKACIMPYAHKTNISGTGDIKLMQVKSVQEAIRLSGLLNG